VGGARTRVEVEISKAKRRYAKPRTDMFGKRKGGLCESIKDASILTLICE